MHDKKDSLDINEGIKCEVKNCVYHDGHSHCKADKIEVGPDYAISCADTVCSTFKASKMQ